MGFPERLWLDHRDEDAFARSANSVCALYSAAVREAQISTRHSELRLFCRHDGSRDDVLVMVHPEITEGFEMAVATLPAGIAALTPQSRARLVLSVVHAAAMRLGQARGWDSAALTAAHAHALAAGLRNRWDGPPKTSPDRRYVAQPRYVLGDDGYGRVVVQVRRRDDGTPVCASPVVATNDVPHAYARALQTLLGQLLEPQWQAWWSAADRTVLLISYDFAANETGIDARRSKDTWQMTILRPTSTFPTLRDHAAAARRDVEAMLSTVRRRTGLGNHPPLSA